MSLETRNRSIQNIQSLAIKGVVFSLNTIYQIIYRIDERKKDAYIHHRVGNLVLEFPKDHFERSRKRALELHLYSSLDPVLFSQDSFMDYARKLHKDTFESFEKLADLCRQDDPWVRGIESFYGTSHLATRRTERWGFTTEDIPFKDRWPYEITSRVNLWILLGFNKHWRNMGTGISTPRRVKISRERLIREFGPTSQPLTG